MSSIFIISISLVILHLRGAVANRIEHTFSYQLFQAVLHKLEPINIIPGPELLLTLANFVT